MSPALSTLPAQLKDLVTASEASFGNSEADKAQVTEWLSKAAQPETVQPASLTDLNTTLVPRTFIVGNTLTAADVALYGALYPVLSQLQPAQYHNHSALTRYFDHIQSRPSVRNSADALAPAFARVELKVDDAPVPERKVEAPKKKEKKPAAPGAPGEAATATKETPAKTETTPAETEGKPAKKEKKEKKAAAPAAEGAAGKKAGGGKAVAEDAGEPVPSMIDLRVGRIVDIKKHPDADGLYVEQIDIGEETGPRTVVSGLVNYIPIENMRDQWLVAVCNLKPANMRGVKSFAMVLCATSKDGKDAGIELVQPPAGSKPGDRVFFEGFENGTALTQLNPKKKIFEAIQPGFITLDGHVAAWVDPATKKAHNIRTELGPCIAPTFIGASLS